MQPCPLASFKHAPRVSFSRGNLVFRVLGFGTGPGDWIGEGECLPETSACKIVDLLIIVVGEMPGVWGPCGVSRYVGDKGSKGNERIVLA